MFDKVTSVILLQQQPMQHSPNRRYYKDVSNLLQEKSFGFISEDSKHDTAFICI